MWWPWNAALTTPLWIGTPALIGVGENCIIDENFWVNWCPTMTANLNTCCTKLMIILKIVKSENLYNFLNVVTMINLYTLIWFFICIYEFRCTDSTDWINTESKSAFGRGGSSISYWSGHQSLYRKKRIDRFIDMPLLSICDTFRYQGVHWTLIWGF